MSTAVEVLEFSRDLIKAGWTRGVWAEDREENSVFPDDPGACYFCLSGALQRAVKVLKVTESTFNKAREALRENVPNVYVGLSLIEFNDAQHSEEPVIDLFDRAIAALKESA